MKPLDIHCWVPDPAPIWEEEVEQLARLVRGMRLCLLTGAGCSTESGIPDYRGEGTAQRARNPIQFRRFLQDERGRRRYWARSAFGWPRFRSALPNRAHRACAALEELGVVGGVITQNVDRLHRKAGSERVVELHGALADVVCLSCGSIEPRDHLQERLTAENPGFLDHAHDLAPDGDADILEDLVDGFRVVDCHSCGGLLKPRVVFFGEGVPAGTVEKAWQLFRDSDALLVAGSSLTVFSGYRFAREAHRQNKPLFIVNIGATRADRHAQALVRGHTGASLKALLRSLQSS